MEAYLALLGAMIEPMLYCLLGLAVVVGTLAIISPRAFEATVGLGNRWVDTWRFFLVSDKSLVRRLDRWFDLDGMALRHGRAVGWTILAVVVVVGYCLAAR